MTQLPFRPRVRAALALALCSFGFATAAHASGGGGFPGLGDTPDVSASITLGALSIQLVDLNPNDGIAPALSFTDTWFNAAANASNAQGYDLGNGATATAAVSGAAAVGEVDAATGAMSAYGHLTSGGASFTVSSMVGGNYSFSPYSTALLTFEYKLGYSATNATGASVMLIGDWHAIGNPDSQWLVFAPPMVEGGVASASIYDGATSSGQMSFAIVNDSAETQTGFFEATAYVSASTPAISSGGGGGGGGDPTSPVPEPDSLLLGTVAALGFVPWRLRRARKAA